MPRAGLHRCRALWAAWALVLLVATAAGANDVALSVDLDGDGQPDRVTLDRREPRFLHVWLSANGATTTLRAKTPIALVVAVDLDGDQRPELIARGVAVGLKVWTQRQAGFRKYRPRPFGPPPIARPTQRVANGGAPDSTSDWEGAGSGRSVLARHARPRAPDVVRRVSNRHPTPARPDFHPAGPLAARPPPALA